MQKLSSTHLLITILVGSLGGNAWFIYHNQTLPRQVQMRQEILSQAETSDVRLSPNPSLRYSHRQSQARVPMTADVDEAVNDLLEKDLLARQPTENELISGLIDSGYTEDQAATIMYDPDSLPQPDSESGMEIFSEEELAAQNKLVEGLTAERLSDLEVDAVLYNPGSLPQPDNESGVEALAPEEMEAEDKLADGFMADGLGDSEIDAVLYDPDSLPQLDSESGLETFSEEELEVQDKLVEGLTSVGLSDSEIDAVLYDPDSLPQPD